ncbi:DEAD/DEAH box helicase [Aeromicrobium sp. CTD01-1L150]|uniref:DEAD/DEAH box helicase n=1 Tax=Aeromicrobium sp. CTD01-1L150 TaxID=3341830 RepID=UPI0035BFEC0F
MDPERLRRVLQQRTRDVTAIEALRAAAGGVIEIDGMTTEVETVGWLDDLRRRLADRGEREPVEQPRTLEGDLRDYQVQGLRWMAQLVDLGLGGILADDMGLGKTVMLIALHLHRAVEAERTGEQHLPTLVVCPASVVGNWEREVQRFAPGVPVQRHHGVSRSLDGVKEGFVITTYATMRRDAELLREHPAGWDIVVADEAQNVKNPRSGAARALRTIPSSVRLALTGTPVENNLAELWAILDWTTPGLLGGHDDFRNRWSRRIENGDDDRAAQLSRLIAPFLLRRRKSDPGIAPELPPKTETDYRVNLTREQVGLYEAVVRDTMAQVQGSSGMARRGLVVKLLTQLKQICNHPAQFLRQPDARLAGRSGKLAVLDELLDDIVPSDGAALVFTQYAQMGHLLQRHLGERGITTQFLHGGSPVRQREQMVRRFQSGHVPVFLLSLRAAGTGLNLTRADHVIHFDRWWNPAVEDQATDRAHRIGQTHAVQVHRLISEGTIEESVAELIASKRSLADAVVNAAEGALTELTDAELADLVRLRA